MEQHTDAALRCRIGTMLQQLSGKELIGAYLFMVGWVNSHKKTPAGAGTPTSNRKTNPPEVYQEGAQNASSKNQPA